MQLSKQRCQCKLPSWIAGITAAETATAEARARIKRILVVFVCLKRRCNLKITSNRLWLVRRRLLWEWWCGAESPMDGQDIRSYIQFFIRY